jgi:hypothetical protein
MAYPIVLTALAKIDYFQPRIPFSILGIILGNPLISIGVVLMAVLVAFPDIAKIDPQALEEAQADVSDVRGAVEKIQDSFLGGTKIKE